MPSDTLRTQFDSVQSIEKYIGKEIGRSSWLQVTQEMIEEFGRVTGDEQWIHMDEERCKQESPYGTTIAHGFFILSLIPKFLAETLTFHGMKLGINYGSDKVRFINAVPSGAEIRALLQLMDVDTMEGGCKYKTKVTIEIRGEEKPACVAEILAIVRF